MFGYHNRPICERDLRCDARREEQVNLTADVEIAELIPNLVNDTVGLIFSFLAKTDKNKVPVVCKSWYLSWLRTIKTIHRGWDVPFSPMTMKNMTHLTVMSGSGSYLTDEIICNLKNLTVLNLSFNEFVTDKGIANLKKLTTLNLERQRHITDDGLLKLSGLTSLNLNDNSNITKRTLDHFAQQLTRLSLFGNQLIDHVLDEVEISRRQETRYDSDSEERYEVTMIRVEKVSKTEFPALNEVSYGFEPAFYGWERSETTK